MTTGVTFFDWGGKPAVIQDEAGRAVLAKGAAWSGADEAGGITAAAIRSTGISIGHDEFEARFAG